MTVENVGNNQFPVIPGMTSVGWQPPGTNHVTLSTFQHWFTGARRGAAAYEWAIGDMANWGENYFGQEFFQILEASDYEDHSIYRLQRISAFYPLEERVPGFGPWKAEMLMVSSKELRTELHQEARTRNIPVREIRERKEQEEGKSAAEHTDGPECPWCGALPENWRRSPIITSEL